MKKTFVVATLASTAVFALASCNLFKKKTKDEPVEFDFSIALASGKTTLEIDDKDTVQISTNIADDSVARSYTYESSNTDRLTVDESGYVVAIDKGSVKIRVTESNSNITKSLDLTVVDNATPASGGFNYSPGAATAEARTEILGKLEKYAVESHLTGITLFENGGYVKYRDRLDIPAKEYITGYGFGILSEGDIKAPLAADDVYPMYYHSAQTSDPGKINAWNATGSQVSDLNGYITSTYWGNKMNAGKDGYEWYPVLAKDEVGGKAQTRPTPVGPKNDLNLYKTWKIYLKTGTDGGVAYRYNGTLKDKSDNSFDNRLVDIKDYMFVYQLLLTGANKQSRGAEMAADKTYGIRGAQAYYNKTKDMTDQALIDATWKDMTKADNTGYQDPSKFDEQDLGILIGTDSNGSYIQLELLNAIDAFTAMYTLSSSLYSPIPREFIEALAPEGTVVAGILNYGINSTKAGTTIVDNTICCSPYYLEVWNDFYLTFKRNASWFEITGKYPERHKIQGVKITTYKNNSQEELYQKFYDGLLDSCGIPVSHIDEEAGKPDVRSTKGDSTFKLNVNSCTQDRWNELNSKLWKNESIDAEWGGVKKWMSNDNFLNGLYWSIDRATFAKNKGAQPSIEYFSNAYLTDPENGVAYNDSQAHKQAIAKWHSVRTVDGKTVDNYGYDYDKAVNCFKSAVTELTSQGAFKLGTASNPTVINIHIRWMYQTDLTDYGNEIKSYFETAFNDAKVCSNKVKLVVNQSAVTNWEDVYNEWMMKGQFDLAFGAISGNTYNPLNFLEVLRSDNSSGFTLNWGADTSKVDTKNPLIYDGHKWSFDALWEVADRGGIVDEGVSVKTVKNCYFDGLARKISDNAETSDYSLGVTQSVNLEFVKLTGAEIKISKVQVYTVGGSNTDVTSYTFENNNLVITINSTLGASLKAELDGIYNKDKSPDDAGYIADIFTRGFYNTYWTFEVYYTLSINGGAPSESYVTLFVSQQAQETAFNK